MSEMKTLQSKKDFQDLLMKIIKPLIPYYSKEKAAVILGGTGACYGNKTIGTEAFLRPLWGLVPFWAGGGEDKEFEEIYKRGLAAGTNPEGAEYWEGFWDGDQRFVEMASIAYGLILTPQKVWDPLSEQEKDNLVNWLNGINQYKLPLSNWIFFAILVNVVLKKLGRTYSKEKLAYYLDIAETYYLGDGWYQDGDSEQKDYYVSFAIHFYSLFYAKVMEEDDPERSKLFKDRALAFAQQFVYWFDENGAALPYGRSLTYRFSQVAFFSACMMADIYPFSVGEMKGLIVRHLEDWMEKPIFDHAGILTIGYGYPNLTMGEIYNAPGSPYWALKSFAVLMLPDEHPFWLAAAAPMPELKEQMALPYADMLIHRYPNHTTAFVPGKYKERFGQAMAKYGKFAYDTRFAFSIAKSNCFLNEAAPDSMLAFYINGYVYTRRVCESFEITEYAVISRWSPYPGIMVESTITPTREGHIRRHRIESEIECEAYDCGFAVQTDVPGDTYSNTDIQAISKNGYSSCEVRLMAGKGSATFIGSDTNTNMLYTMARIPAICYQIPNGKTELLTRINANVFRK